MGKPVACCNIREFRIIRPDPVPADIEFEKVDGGRRRDLKSMDYEDIEDWLDEEDELDDDIEFLTMEQYYELFGEEFNPDDFILSEPISQE